MLDEQKFKEILDEAIQAATKASNYCFDVEMGGYDCGDCGFAWVTLREYNGERIKGNTKIGRMLKKFGITQNHARTFHIWNPGGLHVQAVHPKSVGAHAAATVFIRHGFTSSSCSRLD